MDKKIIAKWVVVFIISIIFFYEAANAALLERGYNAVGGEVVFLFMPFVYALISKRIAEKEVSKNQKRTQNVK